MSVLQGLLIRLGLANLKSERNPIKVFLLDDDRRRHRWFEKRFEGDEVFVAETVAEARELLTQTAYDVVFLDHDLLPHHYKSDARDDENTGFGIALWLAANREIQSGAKIIIHTRNSDAGMRMIEEMRKAGRNVEYVPFPLLDMKIQHYWKR